MQSFLHANAVKGTALQRKLRNLTVIRYFPCIRLLKVANVNFMPSSCSLRYISCAHLFSTSSPSNSRTAYKAPKTYLFTPINLLPQMSRKSLNGSINEQTAKMAWKCWILKKIQLLRLPAVLFSNNKPNQQALSFSYGVLDLSKIALVGVCYSSSEEYITTSAQGKSLSKQRCRTHQRRKVNLARFYQKTL